MQLGAIGQSSLFQDSLAQDFGLIPLVATPGIDLAPPPPMPTPAAPRPGGAPPAYVRVPAAVPAPTEGYVVGPSPPIALAPRPRAAPTLIVAKPVIVPAYIATYAPPPLPTRALAPRPRAGVAWPPLTIVVIPGYGPAGAATFLLEEDGKITFAWATDVHKDWSGAERRQSTRSKAREHYDYTAQLDDMTIRSYRQSLVVNAAAAQPYLIGLPHEALYLTSDTAGKTLNVDTTFCDWDQPGQRVAIVGPDGAIVYAVVQSSTASTIVVDTAPGTAGRYGGRVLPLVPAYLDQAQAFGRHPVNRERWELAATRQGTPGYAGVYGPGQGATVATFDAFPVFDRAIVIDGGGANVSASQAQTGTELVDLGHQIALFGPFKVADWQRQIVYRRTLLAEWAWLKAFLAAVRGRNKAFLLASGRPDMLAFAFTTANTHLTITGADVAAVWAQSPAHSRIAVVYRDGTITYATILSATDIGGGQQDLALDVTLPQVVGNVAMVCWLELCRLDGDEVEISWSGPVFTVDVRAVVVQQ